MPVAAQNLHAITLSELPCIAQGSPLLIRFREQLEELSLVSFDVEKGLSVFEGVSNVLRFTHRFVVRFQNDVSWAKTRAIRVGSRHHVAHDDLPGAVVAEPGPKTGCELF